MERTNSAQELRDMKNAQKPEVQIPTCGRVVHYIPVLPDVIKAQNPDYCKLLPAIVIEGSDLYVNMTVFSLGSSPAESKFSVPHKSIACDENGVSKISYWEWPSGK